MREVESEMIADPLATTWALIERAFPCGVPPGDIDAVIHLLYDHMSDRQLSEVMARLSHIEVQVALNRIYQVASSPPPADRIDTVRTALRAAGFDAWAAE